MAGFVWGGIRLGLEQAGQPDELSDSLLDKDHNANKDLDRLSSETTPQGSISYGYDLAGRRTSMTVAGQPQVTYTYDNADRLTQTAQGSTTVGFGYDDANRRSTLTLSNGVNISYSYDNNSRVTGITYNFGANLLGNLTYSYDSLGRRTQVGGALRARASLRL